MREDELLTYMKWLIELLVSSDGMPFQWLYTNNGSWSAGTDAALERGLVQKVDIQSDYYCVTNSGYEAVRDALDGDTRIIADRFYGHWITDDVFGAAKERRGKL